MATDYKSLKTYTKSQVNGLTKKLNSFKWAPGKDFARHQFSQTLGLVHVTNDWTDLYGGVTLNIHHFMTPKKITREQSQFGKQWLKDWFFKKDGSTRSGKRTENVSKDVLAIASKVSRFEFIGVIGVCSFNYGPFAFLPLYRAYTTKGEYFDYAPVMWNNPFIIEK